MGENSKIALGYARRSARQLGVSIEAYLAEIDAGRKWCIRCRCFHDRSDFGSDRPKRDGLTKACLASYRVKERRPNPGTRMKGKRHSAETRTRMSHARSAAGNANWKGGKTGKTRGLRRTPEYYAWRKAVIERDGRICRSCGAGDRLHAHHISSVKTHPHLATVLENGLTLCPPCHVQEHANG